ncbi:C2 domain-containing protein 5 isoform X2 [Cryptotermes secundus]|nr:C2 domain-containing protein 5 isoform X2 [Cryptotermes secundus]
MPGKVKVKILAGRNLPVMDRSSDTTDAYVEVKLGNTTYKTDVCRKSLNPQWNSEWYRYEVDDSELQDEPLQIRLMDHDTYSANDAIGKVYLDLNPLLLPASPAPVKSSWNSENTTTTSTSLKGGSVMSGWIPVFDTMHGIRGEVNIIVKVELFSDFNKFRQSSCGVQFFCSPVIPQGYHAQVVHGFVEELVVNDDPEYQWIDKIRTPRASNEARQTLFFKLSGEVQRKIGLKALDLGGNAVIGYNQCFDLEGESGIVVRGIGTAVTLTKIQEISVQPPLPFDITAIDDGMVSASAVDDRCYIVGSDSGLLQPLELCVPPPSPKLCITPPTPSIVSPTSPPLSNEQPKESLLPTLVGPGIPGVAKLKSKKKKSRHPVVVLPRYLAAGSKIDHSLTHRHHLPRPEYGRHLSQPAMDVHGIASSCKKMGQSTQSLTSTLEESSLRNLLRQEDMRTEAHCGGRIYRGLRAIRLFPQNKLSKKLISLRTRLQPDSSVDEKESEIGNADVVTDRVQIACAKKSKVKFERRHSRSSSDSMAAAIIRSLMDSNITGLDRVVEVKESPGSSPSSPSRRESYTSIELSKHALGYSDKVSELDSSPVQEGPPDVHITVSESFLRLPSNDDGPELRYVDGHLISNTYSNVSSTSDSSSSEEEASEDYSLDVPVNDKSPTYCTSTTPVIPSQLDVMNTVSIVLWDCGSNVGELHSPVVNGSSTEITPISNVPVLEPTTVDSPQTIGTSICLAGTEQTNAYCFGEGKTNLNLYQQESEATDSASLVEKVNMTTILRQSADTRSVSVQQNNDPENVPSFVNKIAGNTKTDFERNCSFSLPVNDSGEENIPTSTAGDYVSVEVPSNYICTPCIHTEKMKSEKEYLLLQDSGIDNDHSSYASISEYSTQLMQENMLSVSEETVHTVETSSFSGILSLPQNENTSIATPGPSTTPNVLPNQENVTYVCTSVEEGSTNGLSAGNSVHVSPLVKTDNDNSACKLDVVLDVSDSCKTNSVIGMQNLPVGKVSVGMLNIPTSPLHKSQSATTLCSCPTATVKHDTNDEQASPCCGGDLQFHNIKHGPCFAPPSRQQQQQQQQLFSGGEEERQLTGSPQQARPVSSTSSKISPSPAKLSNLPAIHRRSSDSDLSITPKGNSLTGSDRSSVMGGHLRQGPAVVRPSMNQESLDMMEYPFLTMSKYPPGFIMHLGGTVSSRSVKLLERITNLEEPETRDAWWTEIRMEVRSHARALGCNVVLGYSENTSICDDVCVLSASGTAAVINLQFSTNVEQDTSGQHLVSRVHMHNKELMTTSLDRTDFEREKTTPQKGDFTLPFMQGSKVRHLSDGYELDPVSTCSVCHIPYSECSVPFRVTMLKCAICRRGKVPDVLFTTIELPEGVSTTGKGCFLQAYVCRPKRDCRGELNAKEISDGLPFLEYELHRLLINKLKVKGMNSIFGLKVQVSIGEKMLVGLATGTAVYLTPLPMPPVPKVSADNTWADDKKLTEIQKLLQDTVKKNREVYQLKPLIELEFQSNGRIPASDTEESDDELPDLDLATGNKDTCVLEVDDAEDVDVISLLIDPHPPEGFYVVNTETVPGLDDQEIVKNLQMFTQVWRAKIPTGQPTSVFSKHFHRLLQSVYFKLRRMVPCALCDLQFGVELPEPDELQISVLGMALGLGEPERPSSKLKKKTVVSSTSKEAIKKADECELIFNLDEDHVAPENPAAAPLQVQLGCPRPHSPLRIKIPQSKPHHTPPRERYGVDMTPLSYVPGGKIERYLGNLNFFFIRESTCIREGGGLSGFVHSFVTEVLAIVRAHVTALGGNAMVAYFMSECVLYHNPHKNQGQCLINVGGDVVYVSYYSED